jgi:hypothetical protein
MSHFVWHKGCAKRRAMTRRASMDPANIIKGRIAESLIEEVLRGSGNNVYRFGNESILQI